ncbi:hypothetical protein WA538_000574 [Blastocystis sp. DL]
MADVNAIRNLANEGINLTKDVMGKVMRSVRGNDKRFFNSSKKGEVGEWKKQLHSLNASEVTDAMKCVIAAMTIGTDVSMLFPDVISCIHNETLELKKLVYLYLINYARAKPELIILAVNTFVRDTEDPNPLIRALALRTMACIRVQKIVEYLIIPLGKCIDDKDPYVRKTAAICVDKFYDMDPQRCEEEGFIDRLRHMIGDSSPMVVANAVASLCDISETIGRDVLRLRPKLVAKLLAALNECSEWGQIFLLDALAAYVPEDEQEAMLIVEKTIPRLQHVNSAVMLGWESMGFDNKIEQ